MIKICITTTIRRPLHETMMYVNYHLNIGIEHMVLFFDDPADPAMEHLKDYSQVTCIPCHTTHWQELNLTAGSLMEKRQVKNASLGLKFARENSCDWIIHMDSDELIYSKERLQSIFAQIDGSIDVVRFNIAEAVPEKQIYEKVFEQITVFKILSKKSRIQIAKVLGCGSVFYKGEYFKAHSISKSAVRPDRNIARIGLHIPIAGENTVLNFLTLDNIILLHFDCCGFNDWKTKWLRRLDRTATVKCLRPNRVEQFNEFKRVFKLGDKQLSDLYKRLYFIPKLKQFILRRLGLLRYIKLKKELFKCPENVKYKSQVRNCKIIK